MRSTATTSTGWWTRYSKSTDESGQTRINARPTMSDPGIGPMKRLSLEFERLSPITKYCPAGTTWRRRLVVEVPAGRYDSFNDCPLM